MEPKSESATLVEALVEAYRPYVVARLAEMRIEAPPGLDDALTLGSAWLRDELTGELAISARAQRRSPLEVFREAIRFPTVALAAAGISGPERDPAQVELLPDDPYDLAPASSQELGKAAWHAHLAWGVAKARTLAGPAAAVGWLGRDLLDRSRIEPVVGAAGLELWSWDGIQELEVALRTRSPLLALVDLARPDADGAVERLAAAGVRVIAYGPHVDDIAMVRARALGAEDALPRSRFFTVLAGLLPLRA